ncbi:hypothetical protein RJ639_033994, partial [Escallonia herrerae]
MYIGKKYLPGLGRWHGGQIGEAITVTSFSATRATSDQKVLLESIERLVPQENGKSFCCFLLGLLRVALILGVTRTCQDCLERRIGMQLELVTLDSLLIPTYTNSDSLYNIRCVESIFNHFISSKQMAISFFPSSFDLEMSPSSGPLRKVAKLIDIYIAEIVADENLKPEKIHSLGDALPECSRSLHDGLYRALDIYFKMQLRTALVGCLHVMDAENVPTSLASRPAEMIDQIVQRDGWVAIVGENQVLKVNMEKI